MKKSIALILLIGTLGLMAFSPTGKGITAVATATPTPVPTVVPDALPNGMEVWCFPEGTTYAQDPAALQKSDQAIDIVYNGGLTFKGPYSACFVQLPNESQYQNAIIAFFDQSNSGAFYKRSLYKNGDGLIAVIKHTYLVNAPLWQANYRLEIQGEDGSTLFAAPLHYERNWQAQRCWNGNMPNPVTYRCPLQLDLHPWDAGYGKPLPTIMPTEE